MYCVQIREKFNNAEFPKKKKKKKKNPSKNLLLNPINSLSLPMFRALGSISRNIRQRLQRQYVYFVIESRSLGR